MMISGAGRSDWTDYNPRHGGVEQFADLRRHSAGGGELAVRVGRAGVRGLRRPHEPETEPTACLSACSHARASATAPTGTAADAAIGAASDQQSTTCRA